MRCALAQRKAALGCMGQHQFGAQCIVGRSDFQLQCCAHAAAQIGQGDVPIVTIDHQQQRKSVFLRAVPAVEDFRFLQALDAIDHAAGAADAGLALPATTLVIFGNPKAGTPLMQCSRTAAIDLPNKALVWAENGKTWIAVNDMDYLAQRHHMTDCPAVPKVADKLRQLVGQTVAQ